MAASPAGLLPGTLDLLILKAVSLGELHGYGVLLRLQQMTGHQLTIEQGALIPRSIAWNTAACSTPSGARPTTTGARSSIASPPPAGPGSATKPRTGTASSTS